MSIKQILIDTPNLVLDTSVLLGYFMSEARDINFFIRGVRFYTRIKDNIIWA